MFQVGDRVIVTKDIDGNNTKDKSGVIFEKLRIDLFGIEFDEKLNQSNNMQRKKTVWNVYDAFLVLEKLSSEY